MGLTAAAFTQMLATCAAAEVRADSGWGSRVLAVARVESGLDPLIIHDNTSGTIFRPTSVETAIRIADRLIDDRGHKVDLGLMQVDSDNFTSLHLSIPDAFDPCHSITAGSHLLMDGYRQAMRAAYSEYNTGSLTRGLAYAAKVEAATDDTSSASASSARTAELDAPQQSCAPAWDVWASATCGQSVAPARASPVGVLSVSLNNHGVP